MNAFAFTLFCLILSLSSARASFIYVRPAGWTQDTQPIVGGMLDTKGDILVRIVSATGEELLPWMKVGENTSSFLFRPPAPLPTGIHTLTVKVGDEVIQKKLYIDTEPPALAEVDQAVKEGQVQINCLASDRGSGIERIDLAGEWDTGKVVRLTHKECTFSFPVEGKKLEYKITVFDRVGLKTMSNWQDFSLKGKLLQKEKPPVVKTTANPSPNQKRFGPTEPGKPFPFLEKCNRNIFVSTTKRLGQGPVSQGLGGDFEQTILAQVNCQLDEIRLDVSVEALPRQPNRQLAEISGKHESAKIGNFTIGVSGSEFLNFQKQGEGMEIKTEHRPFNAKVIFSESQSFTRTVTKTGNNTKGPYQLGFNIVPGSETVIEEDTQNGTTKTLVRDQDYFIDYFDGEITFTEIKPSFIRFTVSFDFAIPDLALRTGDVTGFQSNFKIGQNQNWQFTFLQEKSARGGGRNTVTRREEILSFVKKESTERDLQREYPLESWPLLPNSETIQVENELKQPGSKDVRGDYFIDFNRGTIVFTFDPDEGRIPPGEISQELIQVFYQARSAFNNQFEIDLKLCSKNLEDNSLICNLAELPGKPTILDTGLVRIWKKKKGFQGDVFVKENLLSPETSNAFVTHYRFEGTNKIIFKEEAGLTQEDSVIVQERQLRQTESPEEQGDVGKRSIALGQSWTLGRHLLLDWEVATSKAEKEALGVKVEEDVIVQPDDIQPDGSAILTLQRSGCESCPLVPESETLQLKKADGSTVVLQRSELSETGNYQIDYNTGRISLSKNLSVQANDIVQASYSFFQDKPDPFRGSVEKVTGSAMKASLNIAYPFMTLQTGFRKVDATFIPIASARSAPENGMLNAVLTLNPAAYLQLQGSFFTKETPEFDFVRLQETGKVTETNALTVGGSLKLKGFPALTLSRQVQRTKDNQQTIDNTSRSMKIQVQKTFGSIATDASFTKVQLVNTVNREGNREETSWNLTSKLSGKNRYSFNAGFQSLDTINPGNIALNNKTNAYKLDGSYQVSRQLQFQINALVQQGENATQGKFTTRNIEGGVLQEVLRIPVPLLKGLKFENIRALYSDQSNTGSATARKTVRGTVNFNLALSSRAWALSPSYSFSKSTQGNTNNTTTNNYGFSLSYSSGGRRRFSFSLNPTLTTNRQESFQTGQGPTKTKSLSTDFRIRFIFPRKLEWNGSFSFQDQDDVSGRSTKTQRPSLNLKYDLGRKNTVSLLTQWNIQEAPDNRKNIRRDITLQASQKLGETANFSANITWFKTTTTGAPSIRQRVGSLKVEIRF